MDASFALSEFTEALIKREVIVVKGDPEKAEDRRELQFAREFTYNDLVMDAKEHNRKECAILRRGVERATAAIPNG